MLNNIMRYLVRYTTYTAVIANIILLISVFGYFGVFTEKQVNPWYQLSNSFNYIYEKKLPESITQGFFAVIIVFMPILLGSTFIYLIYAKKYYQIFKLLAFRKKNVFNVLQVTYDENLKTIKNIANNICEVGVPLSQDEINGIQGKILNNLPSKKFYATTLLEPNEIMDPNNNHLDTIKKTIQHAVLKKNRLESIDVTLERIIVSDNASALYNSTTILSDDLREICRLHKDEGFLLYVIPESKFIAVLNSFNIDEEYLDFLLVDADVIYGFKNDKDTYRTITASSKYTLFIKDEKKDIREYTNFVRVLKDNAQNINELN